MSSDSSLSDYCRLCTISFKVKFGSNLGKQGHSTSENLFRPSKRKDCFEVVSAEICKEVGLPFFFFFFISCNILIGSVTYVAGKFVTWASFTSSLKLQIHPQHEPRLRAANILLTRRTKPAQHGENQNPSVSIRGQQSHPRSKVPRRLLKANQESLSPSLFWTKLKKPISLSLILTSKKVKENAFANKTNVLDPA